MTHSFDYSSKYKNISIIFTRKCIHIYAYSLHPFTPFRLIFNLVKEKKKNNKFIEILYKNAVFWSVHCLGSSSSASNNANEQKGFWKKPNSDDPSIHRVSQSYYYFAIIFDLDPFLDSVYIQISRTTLLMKWHFDEYNNKKDRHKTREKKRVSSFVKFDYLWFLSCIYLFECIQNQYLFLISRHIVCLMTSWKWWENPQAYFKIIQPIWNGCTGTETITASQEKRWVKIKIYAYASAH